MADNQIDVVLNLVDNMSMPAQFAATKAKEVARALEIASDKAKLVAAKQAAVVEKYGELVQSASKATEAIQEVSSKLGSAAYAPDAGPIEVAFARVKKATEDTVEGFKNFGTDAANAFAAAKVHVDAFAEKVSGVADKVTGAGLLMTAAAAGPMLVMSNMQKGFDESLESLKSTVPEERFQALRKAILELSSAYPNASAGLQDFFKDNNVGLDDQIALYKVAANASRTWGTDFEKTGANILATQKRLGLSASEMQQLIEQANALPADQREAFIKKAGPVTAAPNQTQLAQKMVEEAKTAETRILETYDRIASRIGEIGIKIATPWTDSRAIIDGVISHISGAGIGWIDTLLETVSKNETALSIFGNTLTLVAAAGSGLVTVGTGLKTIAEGYTLVTTAMSAANISLILGMVAPLLMVLGLLAGIYALYLKLSTGAAPHDFSEDLAKLGSGDPKLFGEGLNALTGNLTPAQKAADEARQKKDQRILGMTPSEFWDYISKRPTVDKGISPLVPGNFNLGAPVLGGLGSPTAPQPASPVALSIKPQAPAGRTGTRAGAMPPLTPGTDKVSELMAKMDAVLGNDATRAASPISGAAPGGIAIEQKGTTITFNQAPPSINTTVIQNITESGAPDAAGAATAAAVSAGARRSLMDQATEQ